MSNQPTGDYRLVPWAYPPIPGGSENSTAQEPPYDFTEIRVDFATTPSVINWGATHGDYLGVYINIQDFVLNDSSNVSQILWKFVPVEFVSSAGSTFTGQIKTVSGVWTPAQFNEGLVHIMSTDPNDGGDTSWKLLSGTDDGTCQTAVANVTISIVNAQGEVLQTITKEVSG